MSEGADSITHTCENSLTTLKPEDNPEDLPPRTITHIGRRPRFGTGNAPLSPYILIDGKKLRSALALRKKWPPRRVSFPTNDSHLVTGYLEPANPWKLAENVSREGLISAYKESCVRHNTVPLDSVLSQLEKLEISDEIRTDQLNLRGETLDQTHSEPLEEILKRVQFNKVNLEGTSLDEESSVILFDMLEYYESAKHLNISSNQDIGIRGWQACAHMIKKTQCLEQLEAKDVTLNEQYMNILSRALRLVCHLHVLKLENCGLSGRAIFILVTALKMNTGIRELYLADNGLDLYDAIQLGSLLRINNHLQLLDISNNNIRDDGVRDILEGLINQINEDKDGKGLSILVLWNNRLTKNSSPYFNRIITLSKTLETLNIGQNMLTDELLFTVKDALKKNHILLQLGMQSTELTCDGIVSLSEIIEVNQVLQRIDLRDNSIQMTGMRALSSSMKKNKNITQIDLDDKPRTKIDGTLHQYMELVADIRNCCQENEKSRAMDGNTEGSESPQNHSRLCNASSRKISLTCQTLPCSSPSTAPIQSNDSGRSMLEPKRASGGRLRSPAPSPIPSPVASPIPSPSRSRFVVSRVPEATLRSTDSSASSSPVTPPSFGSSPTSFFPSASGSSRFRVSVVGSASTVPSPKSVVASSKANITIGFNFKLDTVESVDSNDCDDVLKSELGVSNDQKREGLCSTSSNTSDLVKSVTAKDTATVPMDESVDVRELSTNRCFVEETSKVPSQDSVHITALDEKCCDVKDNQSNVPTPLKGVTSIENAESVENYNNESTKDIQTHVNINEDNTDSSCTIIEDKRINTINECDVTKEPATKCLNETAQLPQQTKQSSTVQKHSSNLEKLLALFQHPGSFFSDNTSINQLETKSSFQDSVSSMMALGDKFHHYLKEGKEKVSSHGTCAWSSDESSLPAKSKSMKTSNITQMTGLQSLTNMFSSFKLEANLNLFEQSTKSCSKTAENIHCSLEKKHGKSSVGAQDVGRTDVCNSGNTKFNVYNKEEGTNVSTSSNQSLPEYVQSKTNDGHINKDLVLGERCVVSNTTVDACSKIVNNSPLTNVPESKTTVCLTKLMDIPEYSVLEITENNVKKENVVKTVDKVDSILVEKMCDRSLTDSINLTSDSKDSSCNIICDIKVINNVHTIDTTESTHNSVSLHLNTKDDVEDGSMHDTNGKRNNTEFFASKKDRYSNVSNISLIHRDVSKGSSEKADSLNSEVTSICSIDNNNDKEGFANSHNTQCKSVNETDACQTDNETHWTTTTVNSTSGLRSSEITVLSGDIDTDSTTRNAALCDELSSVLFPEQYTHASQEKDAPEAFSTKDDKFPKPSNDTHRITLNEASINNPFVKNTTDNTAKQVADGTSVPTVILSHHEASGDNDIQKECIVDFRKSDTDDLIFCITDISNDGASVEEELSPSSVSGTWSSDPTKTTAPFYDLPQTSHSPTNLLIEKPENIHRNSQDSGICETNLSALDEHIPESMHSHPRESFQESVDSGIESECSSVCVKVEPCADPSREETSYARSNSREITMRSASESIHDLGDYDPSIVQRTQISLSEAGKNANQTYFDTVKCAVVTSERTITGVDVTETTAIGLISDESTTVLAESSTVIHAASNGSDTEQEKEEEEDDDDDDDDEEDKDSNTGEEGKNDMLDYDEDDDEIDEFEEMRRSLEPRYQRYTKWRI